MSRLVRLGAGLAAAGAAHAAVNVRLVRRPVAGATSGLRVSALVPARDERSTIGACVRALLAQDVAEIIVLDDGSSDGTAEAARVAAAGDPRVRIRTGARLPAGWLGKPHACAQLAAAAGGDVLVFLDADVVLEPGAVGSAVALLERLGLDLVAPHPRQVAGSVAERLVQPLLQWSVLTALPLRLAERSPRPSLGAANGQFLVVRREAYERAGGHDAVRAEVLDDLALLRAIKRAGGRGGYVDGTTSATCRMYRDWPQLRDGYGKSLWAAFGSPGGAAAVVGALTLAYLVPPVAALCGSRAGLAGYLAGVAGRVVTARATGGRVVPDAFAHPVSVAAFGYLTARSFAVRDRARWKGRPVRVAPDRPAPGPSTPPRRPWRASAPR
ncbi:MAG: glycosyltransferase [Jatrophihabitans sp.]|nr:MAG: glycosyltransferase [Jatrophihabitans sp.]